ncbi:MAG: universal stress protein [Halobacteriales archaeon]|nr:universal stress protein [Halobacteriales archaeon]
MTGELPREAYLMYDDILIPTDGSEQATNAVKSGLSLAAELGATVHVLTVLDEFESRIVPLTGEGEERRQEYEDRGEEIVTEVAKAADELGVDCETAVRTGQVHVEIQEYVDEAGIDLVVMGSRGLTNLEKVLLGSTADKTIRTVDVPTMVVHRPPQSFVDFDREIHLAGW